MFQSFDVPSRPSDGPPRLAALREVMKAAGLDGFLVPRADAHQGEYVAPHDDRLRWLTGFTGSAGLCAALMHSAAIFVDGRYTLQAEAQVDVDSFEPVQVPHSTLADWLKTATDGHAAKIGFDPWLHTVGEIEKLEASLEDHPITLCPVGNLIDQIWLDQPAPPCAPAMIHPDSLAGETHASKRHRLAATLSDAGVAAALLTLPDSIAWLLNIRGSDIPRNPVVHAFALLMDDGTVTLFIDPDKLSSELRGHLGDDVHIRGVADLETALNAFDGPVKIDPASAPVWATTHLREPKHGDDPTKLPKARKNTVELRGMEAAHQRDAVAVTRFLAWLASAAPSGNLTEIDVVRRLEAFRAEAPELRDISFETIAGSGPNGAIVHYRVTEDTNRTITPGDLLLVDSGGQYLDGTTDITRTVSTGPTTDAQRQCFTRVLKGMIAVSQARWPAGLAGRDLDALARMSLWQAGLDYDHGTGHGVGAYLSVHEGPQGLSRRSAVPLEPGMVVSNEPGYYRAGSFGIRIENLVHVIEAPTLAGADDRSMLAFATLTWAPIDTSLISVQLLTRDERDWLDRYHAEVVARVTPHLGAADADWVRRACAPLT